MNNHVTIEEQERIGIRKRPTNYVVAEPNTAIVKRQRSEVMPMLQNNFDMSVTPTATVTVEMKTSAQDRAWGFLIASMPRTFAFSLAITLLSIVVGGVSLAVSFVILFSVFSVVEIISYAYTLAISAEGTAYMEAKRKWDVVEREQKARWNHYKQLNGGE